MKKLRRLATQVSHYRVRFVLTDYASQNCNFAHYIYSMVWQVNNVVIEAGGGAEQKSQFFNFTGDIQLEYLGILFFGTAIK